MKEFKIQITDEEYKIFCHGIIDPELWIKNAIAGKINNIKKRLVPSTVNEMIADSGVTTIPADEDEICDYKFNQAGYKNAKERKEESEKQINEQAKVSGV